MSAAFLQASLPVVPPTITRISRSQVVVKGRQGQSIDWLPGLYFGGFGACPFGTLRGGRGEGTLTFQVLELTEQD